MDLRKEKLRQRVLGRRSRVYLIGRGILRLSQGSQRREQSHVENVRSFFIEIGLGLLRFCPGRFHHVTDLCACRQFQFLDGQVLRDTRVQLLEIIGNVQGELRCCAHRLVGINEKENLKKQKHVEAFAFSPLVLDVYSIKNPSHWRCLQQSFQRASHSARYEEDLLRHRPSAIVAISSHLDRQRRR